MTKNRMLAMGFGKIYPLYVQKAKNKNRTQAEVDEILCWFTGYDIKGLVKQIDENVDLETFINESPKINPNSYLITGAVCGYKVEEIKDPLIQKIRYMDKLIDELAKGKSMDKILREPK